jgi:tetratricopeptide (TPR) repeat protein
MENGDLEGALAAFRKAVAVNPHDVEAYRDVAAALVTKGDLDGAIAAYRKALSINPKDKDVQSGLADALKVREDTRNTGWLFRNSGVIGGVLGVGFISSIIVLLNIDKLEEMLDRNKAQLSKNPAMNGGIDLIPANKVLQTRNAGEGIKFHLDSAMLKQLQNTPGFVPVIINIQPMNNLRAFLGLNDSPTLKSG